jgi:hypothetical protein
MTAPPGLLRERQERLNMSRQGATGKQSAHSRTILATSCTKATPQDRGSAGAIRLRPDSACIR